MTGSKKYTTDSTRDDNPFLFRVFASTVQKIHHNTALDWVRGITDTGENRSAVPISIHKYIST